MSKVNLIQEWNESLTKASAPAKRISISTELIGDVLCRACGYYLGKLSQLRQYGNSYFVNEHDFYNRIKEKLFSEPKQFQTSSITGNLFVCESILKYSFTVYLIHRQNIMRK